jgi:hypothetical protein
MSTVSNTKTGAKVSKKVETVNSHAGHNH